MDQQTGTRTGFKATSLSSKKNMEIHFSKIPMAVFFPGEVKNKHFHIQKQKEEPVCFSSFNTGTEGSPQQSHREDQQQSSGVNQSQVSPLNRLL